MKIEQTIHSQVFTPADVFFPSSFVLCCGKVHLLVFFSEFSKTVFLIIYEAIRQF